MLCVLQENRGIVSAVLLSRWPVGDISSSFVDLQEREREDEMTLHDSALSPLFGYIVAAAAVGKKKKDVLACRPTGIPRLHAPETDNLLLKINHHRNIILCRCLRAGKVC